MPVKLSDTEKKLLLACDKLLKSKSKKVTFAIATTSTGIIVLLRPQKKDQEGKLVKAACTKAATKNGGKLATFGHGEYDESLGKFVLVGKKAFPAGVKSKIRAFAVDFKLKNLVKVECRFGDGPADTESAKETEKLDDAALAKIGDSTPLEVDSEEELDELIDKLMEAELREVAKDTTTISSQLSEIEPQESTLKKIEAKLKQARSMGSPMGMLPDTLALYMKLCAELNKMRPDDEDMSKDMIDSYKKLESNHKLAKEMDYSASMLDGKQKTAWSKAQASLSKTNTQIGAFTSHLEMVGKKGAKNILAIVNGNVLDELLSFTDDLRFALMDIGTADDDDTLEDAIDELLEANKVYLAARKDKRFAGLTTKNPFSVSIPLESLGSDIQNLITAVQAK